MNNQALSRHGFRSLLTTLEPAAGSVLHCYVLQLRCIEARGQISDLCSHFFALQGYAGKNGCAKVK